MDFKALGRPDFSRARQSSQAPEALITKPNRRRFAMLAEAAQVVRELPGPGEQLHAIMTGTYDLMVLVAAILETKGRACRELRLATLSFNSRNLAEMVRLLESKQVAALTVLCSKFFEEHNKDLLKQARAELLDRGGRIASARSHAKVVTMAFADGAKLVLEGSANLRTNGNREQFLLANSPELHAWHAAWIDDLVSKHETQAPGRTN